MKSIASIANAVAKAGTLILFLALCGLHSADAQPGKGAPEPCGAANGGGANSTNYYGGGNPCLYRYNIPEENLNRVLHEAPYCSIYSRVQVNCSKPLQGNYGQLQAGANTPAGGGAAAGGGQGSAEQYWQRASTLIERNNYRDAIPLLTQAGKMGHPRAQATLGIAYQDGNGVRKDDRQAAYWFGLAAAQGHRASEYALGGMYEEGEGGLPRDQRKAMELYLASARQGFDKAEEIVGLSYLIGDGLPNDKRQAIEWLQKAGAQGSNFGRDLVIVVSDRSAPAQFTNMNALNAYLTKVHQQEAARQAARGGIGSRQDIGVVARINAVNEANQWRASHGCMSCGAYIPK